MCISQGYLAEEEGRQQFYAIMMAAVYLYTVGCTRYQVLRWGGQVGWVETYSDANSSRRCLWIRAILYSPDFSAEKLLHKMEGTLALQYRLCDPKPRWLVVG